MICRSLLGIIDQAITAIVSAVDHGERSVVILIAECEEVMLQKVHLQHSFLPGHGFEIETLCLHDAQVLFRFLRCKYLFPYQVIHKRFQLFRIRSALPAYCIQIRQAKETVYDRTPGRSVRFSTMAAIR